MCRRMLAGVVSIALCAVAVMAMTPASADQERHVIPDTAVFPPWQNGKNNPAADKGLEFTVREVDNLADFHGDLTNAQLVLFIGGNYFFAMASLVAEFELEHPEMTGKIYYETIPPGLLARQMKDGGRITVGNMTWTARPDAYFAGLVAVNRLIDEGHLVGPPVVYATNQLTIMVPRGNPARIKNLVDLGRADVRLALSNPEFEGVARQIKAALVKAGGDRLVETVYVAKVQDGTAILTRMHHRQTPVWLIQGRVDAGVTWRSEAIFQEQTGLATERVDIPADQNVTGIYAGARVSGAIHQQEAILWLHFLEGPKAQAVFARYGFGEYRK